MIQSSLYGDIQKLIGNGLIVILTTTVALPNLIANDIVIVYPMSSITGFINYVNYTAGSTKGDTEYGDVLNGAFGLGYDNTKPFGDKNPRKEKGEYTSSKVSSTGTLGATDTDVVLAWSPVVPGTVTLKYGTTTIMDIDKDGVLYEVTGTGTTTETVDRNGNVTVAVTGYAKGSSVGTVTYGSARDGSNAVTGLGIQTELAPDATGNIRGEITLTNALGTETDYTLTYIYK